jgi:hypothetical protein
MPAGGQLGEIVELGQAFLREIPRTFRDDKLSPCLTCPCGDSAEPAREADRLGRPAAVRLSRIATETELLALCTVWRPGRLRSPRTWGTYMARSGWPTGVSLDGGRVGGNTHGEWQEALDRPVQFCPCA